nr:MAG TPA: hypothetical protein [Caudoviricetes sp.]
MRRSQFNSNGLQTPRPLDKVYFFEKKLKNFIKTLDFLGIP